MVSARSTSPPKSAWPGVSTRLILTPFQVMDAALAKMVMPRSRSWSFESRTRSTTAWWAAKVPVARNSASTRVVLPWSTWATRATLRSEFDMTYRGVLRRLVPAALGSVVGLVFFIVIERDAVLLRQRGVLVVLCRLTMIIVASESQIECAGTSLLQLSRFFEAAMPTLLHGRAPEPRELTLGLTLPPQFEYVRHPRR